MPRKTRVGAKGDDVPKDEGPTPTDPAGASLYEVLGVARTASQQEIRKAYHRLALQHHPDKNRDDENANEKFQKLQKVVSILGDPEKRALYDQTGCIDDEELSDDALQNLCNFMRTLYREIKEEDIIEFETKYRGSEQERKDLLEYYTKWKGKMKRVHEFVLCSDPKLDDHRFKDIIDSAISAGELKESKAYRQWAAEVMKTKPPANPLKRPSKKRKGAETDIVALVSKNQADRKKRFDSLFSSIVAEYGNSSDPPEPTEEEFEAARQRMEARNLKNTRKKK